MLLDINLTLFVWVVGILISMVMSLVGVIFSGLASKNKKLESTITKLDTKLDDIVKKHEMDILLINKEVSQIKYNYLDRFNRVNNNLSDAKIEILKSIERLSRT